MLSPDELERYRASGTWSELFDPSDVGNQLPALTWALALVALGLVTFPYLWIVARGLPDRGWAIARPVGLLLVAWPVWALASVADVEYGRPALATALACLAAGSALVVIRRRRQLGRWLRAHRRVLLVEEAIFWFLFAAVLAVRWSNPDLWHPSLGGEKPMDFAFLNAVVKSPGFPPYDPWFSGGYINYYYFGFVLVAALVELTGIVPAVAYNLAVPTLAAFLGTAAFGAVLAAVGARRARPAALAAACAGAGFVVAIGNLGQLGVIADRLRGEIPLHWWYWNASRAIEAPGGEPSPITEFPAFTYLYADLHAHAIALPFAAVVIVLALAAVRTPLRSGAGAGLGLLLALTLGALWVTNTWDYPTYALVVVVALLLAPLRGRAARLGRLPFVAAGGAAVLALSYLLYLPFHADYVSAFSGVERWRGARTGLEDFLTVHGFFLFVIASALVLQLAGSRRLAAPARLVRTLVGRRRRLPRALRLHGSLVHGSAAYRLALCALTVAIAVAAGLAIAGGAASAVALLVGTLAALVLPRGHSRRDSGHRFVLALVLVGCALTFATEYAVVSDIDTGRTNTVFKTYLQVWVLWGIAAAALLPGLAAGLRAVRSSRRTAWQAAFAALLGGALLYPALATPAKVRDRFESATGRTLDGMAFMERARHSDRDTTMPLAEDLAAIRWLQRNAAGSPVVAEANTYPTLYGWGNRFAMFTGNPAIVGWDYHERQQRSIADPEAVPARIADVQRLYRTTSAATAAALLERYGARYVVVGRLERAYFPEGLTKWAQGEGRFWVPAFRDGDTTVYRVVAGSLAERRQEQPGRAASAHSASRNLSQRSGPARS
jgi:YYY domain-containing protein